MTDDGVLFWRRASSEGRARRLAALRSLTEGEGWVLAWALRPTPNGDEAVVTVADDGPDDAHAAVLQYLGSVNFVAVQIKRMGRSHADD